MLLKRPLRPSGWDALDLSAVHAPDSAADFPPLPADDLFVVSRYLYVATLFLRLHFNLLGVTWHCFHQTLNAYNKTASLFDGIIIAASVIKTIDRTIS